MTAGVHPFRYPRAEASVEPDCKSAPEGASASKRGRLLIADTLPPFVIEGLPTRPTDHAGPKETAVRPLVDAALTNRWRPALNLLYFHSSLLGLSEDIGLPVLVSLRGDQDGLEHVIELLKAQATSRGIEVARSWAKVFIPRLFETVKEAVADGRAPEDAATLGATVASQMVGEDWKNKPLIRDAGKKLFEDAVTYSGGLAGFVFEFLAAKRASHLANVLPEVEYERMVQQLSKLGVIEPRLEVSVCPNCQNHYFVVATRPSTPERCSRCGHSWVTVEVFVFHKRFAELGLGSSLMAIFISAYLREKVHRSSILLDADIYPLASMRRSDGTHQEVDVFVPRIRVGFECKTFEDVFAPLTPNRLGSVTGKLLDQVKGYDSIGIDSILVATNLPETTTERVLKELSTKLAKKPFRPRRLRVVAGRPDALIQILDKVADELSDEMNRDVGKSFQQSGKSGPRPDSRRRPGSQP